MAELRNGMWVIADRKVGILTDVAAGTVDLVDEDGLTLGTVTPEKIRQAGHGDIPKARRPAKAVAASLGYL